MVAGLYGVPSDPLKNAQFREASRQRLVCLESGACDATNPAMRAFDRLLVKVPEHTWGVAQVCSGTLTSSLSNARASPDRGWFAPDQGWFLPDYQNCKCRRFACDARSAVGLIEIHCCAGRDECAVR